MITSPWEWSGVFLREMSWKARGEGSVKTQRPMARGHSAPVHSHPRVPDPIDARFTQNRTPEKPVRVNWSGSRCCPAFTPKRHYSCGSDTSAPWPDRRSLGASDPSGPLRLARRITTSWTWRRSDGNDLTTGRVPDFINPRRPVVASSNLILRQMSVFN